MVAGVASVVEYNEIIEPTGINVAKNLNSVSFEDIVAQQDAKAAAEWKPWTSIPSNVAEYLNSEGFQTRCCDEKIGSYEEYVEYRQQQTHSYIESDETYKNGYSKYMEERECSNEDELAILNSTPFFSISQMTGCTAQILSYLQNLGSKYGIELDSNKLMSLCKSTDLQNIADFANAFLDKIGELVDATHFKGVNTGWPATGAALEIGLNCMKDFIADVYQQSGLSDSAKSDLIDLFKSISPDESLLKYIEEQKENSEAKSNCSKTAEQVIYNLY